MPDTTNDHRVSECEPHVWHTNMRNVYLSYPPLVQQLCSACGCFRLVQLSAAPEWDPPLPVDSKTANRG